MSNQFVHALWAFVAGAGIPVMASLSGSLGRLIGSGSAAALVLFMVGLMCTAVAVALSGSAPALPQAAQAPPHLLLGGAIVAFYILSVTALTPQFGVANTILFVMVAQIIMSSAIDNFGLFGATPRPVGAMRLAGLLLLVISLFIAQIGQNKP